MDTTELVGIVVEVPAAGGAAGGSQTSTLGLGKVCAQCGAKKEGERLLESILRGNIDECCALAPNGLVVLKEQPLTVACVYTLVQISATQSDERFWQSLNTQLVQVLTAY